jgi:RNA polymerase sigma-B factor
MAGELRRYFRDCGWAVHVPRPEQERLMAVRNASRAVTGTLGRSPTPREIADAAGLTVEDVLGALETETAANPASLDAAIRESDTPILQSDSMGIEDDRLDFVERRADASHGLRLLERREQQILYMRFFENLRQAEIAERIGVSQMQVSRLLRRALERSRVLAGEPPTER